MGFEISMPNHVYSILKCQPFILSVFKVFATRKIFCNAHKLVRSQLFSGSIYIANIKI